MVSQQKRQELYEPSYYNYYYNQVYMNPSVFRHEFFRTMCLIKSPLPGRPCFETPP